ncbi:MAG: hypothetical protein GXP08_04695 [Gammaproteobacteria bacterium]|nr:hypothetical protein [Gammaproteobacteria bacterium]
MTKNTIKILRGSVGHFPLTLALLQNKLTVTIYYHTLLGTGRHIPCWTYITQGMKALKQKEFVFTLKLKTTDDEKKFSTLPLQLFMFLYQNASQNKRVDIGDTTSLSKKGLFGFSGLGYTFGLINSSELSLPVSCLSCVLLTKEELLVAQTLGLSRIIARMGYEKNRFPLLPWNDRQRSSFAFQRVLMGSAVSKLKSLPLKNCTVSLVAGDKVVLVLSTLLQRAMTDYVEAKGGRKSISEPVCLLTQIAVYHQGCLVWHPDKDSIAINTLPDGTGELIAGSFLILAPDKEKTSASMLEDGFLMEFNDASWPVFKNAVIEGLDVNIAASDGGMDFCLRWQAVASAGIFNFTDIGLDENQKSSDDDKASEVGLLSRVMNIFKR